MPRILSEYKGYVEYDIVSIGHPACYMAMCIYIRLSAVRVSTSSSI